MLLRYSLSLPVATAVAGMPKPEHIEANVETARDFKPLSATEMENFWRTGSRPTTNGTGPLLPAPCGRLTAYEQSREAAAIQAPVPGELEELHAGGDGTGAPRGGGRPERLRQIESAGRLPVSARHRGLGRRVPARRAAAGQFRDCDAWRRGSTRTWSSRYGSARMATGPTGNTRCNSARRTNGSRPFGMSVWRAAARTCWCARTSRISTIRSASARRRSNRSTPTGGFGKLAEFFDSVRYVNAVPQLVREPERSVGRRDDPFCGDLLERIAGTPEKTQSARLRRILQALQTRGAAASGAGIAAGRARPAAPARALRPLAAAGRLADRRPVLRRHAPLAGAALERARWRRAAAGRRTRAVPPSRGGPAHPAHAGRHRTADAAAGLPHHPLQGSDCRGRDRGRGTAASSPGEEETTLAAGSPQDACALLDGCFPAAAEGDVVDRRASARAVPVRDAG